MRVQMPKELRPVPGWPAGERMAVVMECPECHKDQEIHVAPALYEGWVNGALLIQQAFPALPVDQREALMTGRASRRCSSRASRRGRRGRLAMLPRAPRLLWGAKRRLL
jgi:hypothetical protein